MSHRGSSTALSAIRKPGNPFAKNKSSSDSAPAAKTPAQKAAEPAKFGGAFVPKGKSKASCHIYTNCGITAIVIC